MLQPGKYLPKYPLDLGIQNIFEGLARISRKFCLFSNCTESYDGQLALSNYYASRAFPQSSRCLLQDISSALIDRSNFLVQSSPMILLQRFDLLNISRLLIWPRIFLSQLFFIQKVLKRNRIECSNLYKHENFTHKLLAVSLSRQFKTISSKKLHWRL